MRTAYVISGVSGVGKTWLRTNSALADLPCFDIADYYTTPDTDWRDALDAMIYDIATSDAQEFVVEGYFLDGTPSNSILERELKIMGAILIRILMRVPWQICEDRIAQQFQRGEISAENCRKRLELLHRCS